MPIDKQIKQMSEFFKAMGDPTRLKIVSLIASSGNLCVNMVSNKIGMTQPAISQHLKILKQAGILDSEKLGLEVHYRLNEDIINQYINDFSNLFKSKDNQCLKCPEKK
jgi:ArsR family transcriptional regulator, arsenate/arsenite/antimonite-responsive transcriptional repressor